jgi:hypothetical protein
MILLKKMDLKISKFQIFDRIQKMSKPAEKSSSGGLNVSLGHAATQKPAKSQD